MSTDMLILPPMAFCSRSEISTGLLSSNSMPLMREMPTASGAKAFSILGTTGARKLCGMTKTIIVAPVTAVLMSGVATIFSGSLIPGR